MGKSNNKNLVRRGGSSATTNLASVAGLMLLQKMLHSKSGKKHSKHRKKSRSTRRKARSRRR